MLLMFPRFLGCAGMWAGTAAGPVGSVAVGAVAAAGAADLVSLCLLVVVALGRLGRWQGWVPLGLVRWWWPVGRPAFGRVVWLVVMLPLWFR